MDKNECSAPHLKALLGAFELGLLPEEERRSVEEHVLQCDECFEDLYDTAPLRNIAAPATSEKRQRRVRWHIPALAAAVLLLAFSTTFYLLKEGAEVKRSTFQSMPSISLEQPRGLLEDTEIHFKWKSPAQSLTYLLTVYDMQGDIIWSSETSREEMVVHLGKEIQLESGMAYFWKVEGRDASGRLLTSSEVASFSYEAR
jgi:hypothetical protein